MQQPLTETRAFIYCAVARTVPPTRQPRLKLLIESSVAVVFGISQADLQQPSRGEAQVALARQVAMYLLHCVFRVSYAEIGRMFNRDRTTVCHACNQIEDRRDDPIFERVMGNLEEIVCRICLVAGSMEDL